MAAAAPVTKPLARPASHSAARVPGQAAPLLLAADAPPLLAGSAAGRPPCCLDSASSLKTMDLARQ